MRWQEISENDTPWATSDLTKAPNKIGVDHPHYLEIQNHQYSSKAVNRFLLRNKGLMAIIKNIFSGKNITRKIDTLDNILANLQLPLSSVVYHGTIAYNPGETAKQNGGMLDIPAYLSVTTDRNVAYNFAGAQMGKTGHILQFKVPAGFNALEIGGVEHEILLPRGLKLRVNPTPNVLTNGISVWMCELVHD